MNILDEREQDTSDWCWYRLYHGAVDSSERRQKGNKSSTFMLESIRVDSPWNASDGFNRIKIKF
jgi:hypothetical protein